MTKNGGREWNNSVGKDKSGEDATRKGTGKKENKSMEREAITTAREEGKEKMVRYESTSEDERESGVDKVNRMLVGILRVLRNEVKEMKKELKEREERWEKEKKELIERVVAVEKKNRYAQGRKGY